MRSGRERRAGSIHIPRSPVTCSAPAGGARKKPKPRRRGRPRPGPRRRAPASRRGIRPHADEHAALGNLAAPGRVATEYRAVAALLISATPACAPVRPAASSRLPGAMPIVRIVRRHRIPETLWMPRLDKRVVALALRLAVERRWPIRTPSCAVPAAREYARSPWVDPAARIEHRDRRFTRTPSAGRPYALRGSPGRGGFPGCPNGEFLAYDALRYRVRDAVITTQRVSYHLGTGLLCCAARTWRSIGLPSGVATSGRARRGSDPL
jgi:hypothetical protein